MIFYGNAAGRITLRVEHGVLWIKLEQDPHGADIVQSFRDAISEGLLKAGIPTVVDMLGFNGNIDWQAIRTIREMVVRELSPPETSKLPEPRELSEPPQLSERMAPAWQPERPGPATECRVAYVTRDTLFAPVLRILRDLFYLSRLRQFRDLEAALLWVCRRDPVSLDED